jgi:hypothetical protein
MNGPLGSYSRAREALLSQLREALVPDERCVAAWQVGSLGQGQGDAVSDVDLTVVVSDEAAELLCARPWQVAGRTTAERYALFGRFGRPAVIHENQNNAPAGGSFTFVAYAPTGLMIDWVLISQADARRPLPTQLLFEKAPIPLQTPLAVPSLAHRVETASERVAYFWMMAAVTVKYIVRQDTLQFNSWLDELHWLVEDVKGLLRGEPAFFDPRARLPLALRPIEQQAALRKVCQEMHTLMPGLTELGGLAPSDALALVETRLSLIDAG